MASGALVACVMAGALAVGQAGGVGGQPGSPGSPSGQGSRVEPVEEDREYAPFVPVVEKEVGNTFDWTVEVFVRLLGVEPIRGDLRQLPTTVPIDIEGAVIVLPLPDSGGYSIVKATEPRGKIDVRGRVVDNEPRILDGYQAGQRLAALDVGRLRNVVTVSTELKFDVASFETDVDEERAQRVPWPEVPYEDPMIRSALQPQMFIESDDRFINDLVDRWTRGNPRKVPPYVLAKFLASRVLEAYAFENVRFAAVARGQNIGRVTAAIVEGLWVRGASETARAGGGGPYDLCNLLCAVYRAAGIPARVVIGYDQRRETRDDVPMVICWVEFWLAQPGTGPGAGEGEWVPVDIVRQRLFSSQPQPLEQKWQFFGQNEDGEFYCPVSHHWHPPTVVVNQGPPALWGWLPVTDYGGLPYADQELRLQAQGTPLRGDDTDEIEARNERRGRRGR